MKHRAAPPRSKRPPRVLVLQLAAVAESDTRSAEKAIVHGAKAVRGIAGERLSRGMRELGIKAMSEVPDDAA